MPPALDKRNRLVMPKVVRERLAHKLGDELEITVEVDDIKLRSVQPASPIISKKNGILVCSSEVPAASRNLSLFIKQQRAQRLRELGGL